MLEDLLAIRNYRLQCLETTQLLAKNGGNDDDDVNDNEHLSVEDLRILSRMMRVTMVKIERNQTKASRMEKRGKLKRNLQLRIKIQEKDKETFENIAMIS